ncbi:MAG: biopolymer transporter ExbD [Spongiibacteraceae bacterium]
MRRVKNNRSLRKEAELDITAFMNLMIVLVPVLLLGMVFSQITVLDIKLPESANSAASDSLAIKQLELIIQPDGMLLNYPRGTLLKRIAKIVPETSNDEVVDTNSPTIAADMVYDYKLLSLVLQEVKRQLRETGIENRSITVLSQPDTPYQTIVSTMDTVRSYKAVVVTSVVDAELFPEISFGDAPVIEAAAVDHAAAGEEL